MISKDFLYKFTIPELSQIAGKKYINIILLSFFLILVLTAIGISKGSIDYLKKQMDSRYVTLTSIKIPSGFDKDKLNNLSKIKNKHGIVRTFPVFEEIRTFANPNNPKSEYKSAQIRKGMDNDPVISDFKDHSFNYDGWGCIVTKGFLKDLGYPGKKVPYISYLKNVQGEDVFIKIPVEGIIDDLPDYLDMIVGEKFYKSFQDDDYWQELITKRYNNKYLRIFFDFKSTELKSKLSKYGFNEINHNVYSKGQLYELNNVDSLYKTQILQDFNSFDFTEVFDFHRVSSKVINSPIAKYPEIFPEDKYVFQFHNDSLNKIKDFNKILASEYRHGREFLKIDLSIINSKKNFDIIKDLVELLSRAIYFLSLLSIFLYLWNLIVNHINSNKKNLGTLKAFGLSNFTIVGIYSFISITMIEISLTIAFVVSFFLGQNIMDFLTNILNLDNLSEMKFLSEELKDLFLIFIIIPAFILMLMIYNKLKNKTPGDLIYERNNN